MIGVSTPRRDTMADRASAVAKVRLNPVKFVGYVDETITFTAVATDSLDRTIQGVKFSWDEQDGANTLRIDEAGRATFLQPGLARIVCRAGSVEATARVLIRPSHRPKQTDAEWRADQAGLAFDPNTIGSNSASTAIDSLASLLDKLVPIVQGQSFPPTDVIYEVWTDPANLLGNPRNRVIEPTAIGTVMPEGSNFNLAIPVIGLGGRGLSTNLTLFYNSRVWSRHSNKVTFDALTSWPTPGFSLGFGRMVTWPVYDQYGVLQYWKFAFVEADGTRHAFNYPDGKATDGSGLIYSGDLNLLERKNDCHSPVHSGPAAERSDQILSERPVGH